MIFWTKRIMERNVKGCQALTMQTVCVVSVHTWRWTSMKDVCHGVWAFRLYNLPQFSVPSSASRLSCSSHNSYLALLQFLIVVHRARHQLMLVHRLTGFMSSLKYHIEDDFLGLEDLYTQQEDDSIIALDKYSIESRKCISLKTGYC
ncbi:hypothetical protein STEG23_000612 [Scotinomys teguina]